MPKQPACTCGACHRCKVNASRRQAYHTRVKNDPERLAKHREQSREGERRWRENHRERYLAAHRERSRAERALMKGLRHACVMLQSVGEGGFRCVTVKPGTTPARR